MGPVKECLCGSRIDKRNVYVGRSCRRFRTNYHRAEDDPRTLHGVDSLVPMNGDGRNYVTGEMWKNIPPFRFAVNNGDLLMTITWHFKHYTGQGESRIVPRLWCSSGRGYGSARLEDKRINQSPYSRLP